MVAQHLPLSLPIGRSWGVMSGLALTLERGRELGIEAGPWPLDLHGEG
jgi:hypothetical protein